MWINQHLGEIGTRLLEQLGQPVLLTKWRWRRRRHWWLLIDKWGSRWGIGLKKLNQALASLGKGNPRSVVENGEGQAQRPKADIIVRLIEPCLDRRGLFAVCRI